MSENIKLIKRVSYGSIIVNILLFAFKLIAGLVGCSAALLSDAIHSASDVFSTIIVLIGIHISKKAADKEHEYGHERMECLAAIILAAVLFATGLMIGISGVRNIYLRAYLTDKLPALITIIAAAVSIIVKEIMYQVTAKAAKKVSSSSLMADAWHHRSDALSSVGSLSGIILSRAGFPIGDPIASIIICAFIIKASTDIFKDAADKLTDHSCDTSTEEKMRRIVNEIPGVKNVDLLKTRQFGMMVYVDMEIAVDGYQSLFEAHAITENVHTMIENNFENVKHCMVHANPYNAAARDIS